MVIWHVNFKLTATHIKRYRIIINNMGLNNSDILHSRIVIVLQRNTMRNILMKLTLWNIYSEIPIVENHICFFFKIKEWILRFVRCNTFYHDGAVHSLGFTFSANRRPGLPCCHHLKPNIVGAQPTDKYANQISSQSWGIPQFGCHSFAS